MKLEEIESMSRERDSCLDPVYWDAIHKLVELARLSRAELEGIAPKHLSPNGKLMIVLFNELEGL